MATYSASSADSDVVAQAYAAARKLTSDPTILQALFEAGLVESHFHNLSGGDRDSEGYLQQRPSQGWVNPTDIPTATKSFIDKAKKVLASQPGISAGDLAQAVQRSAYPARYGEAGAAAKELLTQISDGTINAATDAAATAGGALADLDPLALIADAISHGLSPLTEVSTLGTWLMRLTLPSTIIRAVAFVGACFCLLFGIGLLAREVRK